MPGITDLNELIRSMRPVLNAGLYVFCTTQHDRDIDLNDVVGWFREREGATVIIEQKKADALQLSYSYVAAWITLEVHSSLAAVGLTAAFANALAAAGISCNVVAGFYHDHIFVAKQDAEKAMAILTQLAGGEIC